MKKLAQLLLSALAIIIASHQISNAQINVYLGKQSILPADWFGYNGANVIRGDQPTYDTQWFMDSLSNLSPTVVRYPAGLIGNFWDWQIGHFLRDLPQNLVLPKDFYDSEYRNLDFYQLKNLTERVGVTPIFNLNILTSDKYYQTASLMFANSINLPVKYLEFGNELYIDSKINETVFPTAEDYINTANDWANYIKSRPGFANYKIAVVGSTDKYPAEPRISRKNRWTSVVAAGANSNIDAVTLHWYLGASIGTLAVNEQTAPAVLAGPFSGFEGLKNELSDIGNAGKEAWVTEFNLYDTGHCLHQHFIHGLFTSAMALSMLQAPTIRHVDCHALVGSSVFASLFNDSLGFDLTGFTDDGLNCVSNNLAPTNTHELTSQGVCLQLVGRALKNAKTKRQLAFANSPKLPGGYDALFGFQLDGPLSTEMIILNLDSVSRTVDIDSNTWNLSQGKYISVYPGPGGVLDVIKGNPKLNPGQMECTITGYLPASQSMLLKAYSVTRIFVTKNSIKAKASDYSICSGTTTALQVTGGASYTWTGTNLSEIKADKSVMRFTAPDVSASTTFKFNVISSDGFKDSVNIVVNPKPVVTVHSDYDHVCKGSQVKLFATLSGGNTSSVHSIIWTPTSSITNPDADTAFAYPYSNTTYRCYATDGICWAAYDSVNVTVNSKADAGPDYSLCDDSLPYILRVGQYDPLLNYQWFKNGVLIGTGSSVAVSPAAATTYRLKVSSNIINGCVDSDDVTIIPFTCCPSADFPSSLTFIPGQTLKTDLIPRLKAFCAANPGHGYCSNDTLRDFHDEIMFNGDFYADCNFTFVNCDKLKFGEIARIRFAANTAKVKFLRCNLNSENCSNKMWRGFYMDDFNSQLTLDSCTITNAEAVVEGQRDPDLYITNTKFERCYMGVYLHDNEQDLNGKFYGDTMSFSGSLKAPHAGEKPLCAFKLVGNPSITIGDTAKPANYWNNIQYGFIGNNSDITCYNNKFENILKSDSLDGTNGTAIYMINPFGYGNINDPTQLWPEFHFSCGADSTAYPNKFINCDNGIYIENGDANIRGNLFTGSKKAIQLIGCMMKQLDVRFNTITGADVGMDMLEAKYSNLNIYNNSVSTNNQENGTNATPAVRIIDVNGENSILTIKTNVIHSGGTHGIWIQNNHKVMLADNKVYLDNPNTSFTAYGMRIENVDSMKTRCNLAKGNSAASTSNKINMSFSYCPSNTMDCNTLDLASTGVEYLANCNNSIIRNNDFKYLDDGMVIGGIGLTSGIIGPQPLNNASRTNNNKFYGQYIESVSGSGKYKGHFGHAATYAVNSQCSGTKGSSKQFFVYKADSLTIPYPNLSIGSDASPITPYYQTKAGVECIISCLQPNPNRLLNSSNGKTLINDSEEEDADLKSNLEYTISEVIPTLHDDATIFSVKSELFNELKNDELKMAGSAALQQFYNETLKSNIARIVAINDAIKQLNQPAQGMAAFTIQLQQLIEMNNALIPTNAIESSEKRYNSLYFKSLAVKDKLSEPDIKSLKKLADQCPYIAGTSVFKARALYVKYNPNVNYDDSKLCMSKYQLNDQQQSHLNLNDLNVVVYPNPNNGEFTINYDLTNFNRASIVFFNVIGKKVWESDLNVTADRSNLQMKDMSEGIYSYTVYGNGNPVSQGKITIIK
ncbi:MAG: T9SS type A sorting domain-containing protein [Bacteroidia bacterium]